jgi:DNA modification methylase
MCGDSTNPEDVARLMGETKDAPTLHADPPYGMGKQADGVLNDNLYAAKLDAFQMGWWGAWRPFLAVNGSAYVWGNAEDLWRLWHGSLAASERMTIRNEIVWNKGAGMGMNSDHHRQFATVTERCLFFMLGEQGFGNVNKDDYWEGFEPIRGYLEAQAKEMGWGPTQVNKICAVGMFSHWFSKSQWTMIPEKHYATLQAAAEGRAFLKPYAELRHLYDGKTAAGEHLTAKRAFYGTRAFFDNVHDNMSDVWTFPRVTGEDRHGHATPKPVDLVARAIKSSTPDGGAVLEPFCGSGSTLIAAETCGRVCFTMELNPTYVDVTVRRWQAFTGEEATLEGDGRTFAQVQAARLELEPATPPQPAKKPSRRAKAPASEAGEPAL